MPAHATSALPLLTPRLRLRVLREDDLDDLFAVYTHACVAPIIGPHTREEVAEELRFHIAHRAQHGWSMWAVEVVLEGPASAGARSSRIASADRAAPTSPTSTCASERRKA